MATFKTKVYTGAQSVPQPDCAEIETVAIDVDFPSSNFSSGDFILLTRIPIGVSVVDYSFIFPDIDSNASPAFAFTFGAMATDLSDIATAYVTGVTAGQSNAIVRGANAAAAQAATTAERVLAIKVTTVPATYAGSGLTGQVLLALRG